MVFYLEYYNIQKYHFFSFFSKVHCKSISGGAGWISVLGHMLTIRKNLGLSSSLIIKMNIILINVASSLFSILFLLCASISKTNHWFHSFLVHWHLLTNVLFSLIIYLCSNHKFCDHTSNAVVTHYMLNPSSIAL